MNRMQVLFSILWISGTDTCLIVLTMLKSWRELALLSQTVSTYLTIMEIAAQLGWLQCSL